MGERLANNGLSERLLGLDQRLIDRLQPLSNYEVSVQPLKAPDWVQINHLKKSEEASRDVGGIKIFFGEEVKCEEDERDAVFLDGFNPNILGSSLYSFRGPFSALSMTLTLMATIDQTARVLGEDLLHLVRANGKARPYFQRFREAGLYHYCDRWGKTSRKPVELNSHELYMCRYPVEGIDSVIGRFAIDEAVGEIIKMREERMKDYDPRPLWSFIKNLLSG